MDTLTFISNVIDAVAWPAAIVILFLALRRPFSNLIPLVTSLKYKDLELQFGSKLRHIEEAKLPEGREAATPPAESERMRRLAEISPRAAVLESWINIELAALSAARALLGDELRNKTLSYQAIRALEHSRVLGVPPMKQLDKLKILL
jgi:hypothetical protein